MLAPFFKLLKQLKSPSASILKTPELDRTLSTINDISSDQSNTVVFCLPIEILDAIKGHNNDKK